MMPHHLAMIQTGTTTLAIKMTQLDAKTALFRFTFALVGSDIKSAVDVDLLGSDDGVAAIGVAHHVIAVSAHSGDEVAELKTQTTLFDLIIK